MMLRPGDCRDVLLDMQIDGEMVDAVITDPPYDITSTVERFGKAGAAPAKDATFARMSRGFMGQIWDGTGVAFEVATWEAVWRVMKPGAHLLAFGGSRTYHRMACAIEDAGFELRDCIMWLYGTGFPKSHDPGDAMDREMWDETEWERGERSHRSAYWNQWGTALKPAFEPIIVARKPLGEKTVAANVLAYGTGAINIDACRVPGAKPDTTRGAGGQHGAFSPLPAQGRITDDGAGRHPANVIHDGSEEVEAAFAQFGVKTSGSRAAGTYGVAGSDTVYGRRGDTGTASRFFYNTQETDQQWLAQNLPDERANDVPDYSRLGARLAASVLRRAVERSTQLLALNCKDCLALSTDVTPSELRAISEAVIETILSFAQRCSHGLRPERHIQSSDHAQCVVQSERTDTITITASLWKSNGFVEVVTFTTTLPNSALGVPDSASRFHYSAKAGKADRAGSGHPTVKPLALMRYLCKLVTPPGGTVLDPFAGSGTTLQAALECGFNPVGIEREPKYIADIEQRLLDHLTR